MSPNPSKVMAPVQMQSSPMQMQAKDRLINYESGTAGREKAGRVKGKVKDKERGSIQCKTPPTVVLRDEGLSPKAKSVQNVCRSSEQKLHSGKKTKGKSGTASPPLKQTSGQGNYNGRKSISPDGSYAGAKFSEAPNPDQLPMPPSCWLSSFSSGKKKVKSCPQFQECSLASHASAGQSSFDEMARDLKMMLKVES